MTDDDPDLEQLRAQTETGDRLDSEGDLDVDGELVGEITEHLGRIDDGDLAKTVSVWDTQLAALFAALDDRPEDCQRIADALAEELGAENGAADGADRSDVIRLAARVGLRAAPDDVLEAADEARQRHATNDPLGGL